MYTLTRKSQLIDQLALKHDNGDVETLNIYLAITSDIVGKYRKLQIELLNLEKKDKSAPDVIEEIGKCVTELLCLLLGAENTTKILAFYQDDVSLALNEVFPYIQNVIVPKFKEIARERKKALKRRT